METAANDDPNGMESSREKGKERAKPACLAEYASVKDFAEKGLKDIVEATKHTNALPWGASRDLYSAHPSFCRIIDDQSNRVLDMLTTIIQNQNIKGNMRSRDRDERFELLLECNDMMLEKINSNLDEMSGLKKQHEPILMQSDNLSPRPIDPKRLSGSWNVTNSKTNANGSQSYPKLLTAKNILRPQMKFKTPVDNSSKCPFEPRLKYKPNSIKPLAILAEYDDDGNIRSYLHPYEVELEKFQPPSDYLKASVVQLPQKIADTPLVFVDNELKLKSLLTDLVGIKELAVDLEHHSYRTFQGITCLMQLSTRTKDYIIDAIALRDELHVLNEIFTSKEVVKIFHGADSDIEWLQRDMSLYIVNMFDTHQAARRLGLARLSLAYLLKNYCQIDADKTYQLADWRIRPIPQELIDYARQDTHFLLYIHDLMKNELLKIANNETHILLGVLNSSTEICKKRYVKFRLRTDSHMELYEKSKRVFDNRQLYALRELFRWRDSIARQEDESSGYVLPNHMLLQIAESLPREMQGILACCNPIPPMVRQHLHALHSIALRAREQPLVKPVIEEMVSKRTPVTDNYRDLSGPLYCPHEIAANAEFRDDLPTLLGKHFANKAETLPKRISLAKPVLTVFECPNLPTAKTFSDTISKLKKIKFVSPYERYKSVLPFAESQRIEEQKKTDEIDRSKLLCPIKPELNELFKNSGEAPVDEIKPLKAVVAQNKRKAKREHLPELETASKKLKQFVSSDEPAEKTAESIQSTPATIPPPSVAIENGAGDTDKAASSQSQGPAAMRQGKKNKRERRLKNADFRQNSNKPPDFDYAQVNYGQFKGGSKHDKVDNVKTKFHGKNKPSKANQKQFNKLFTFSSVHKGKK